MSEIIPKALLERLTKRLNVSTRHVRRLINKRAGDAFVSNRAGALLLARDAGLNFQQYASATDLAEMRGAPRPSADVVAAVAHTAPLTSAVRRAAQYSKPIKQTKNNSIFVVHGRDTRLNEAMFALLRAFGLNPMEWSAAIAAAKGANPDVGAVINNAMKKVQGVLVMFSPDEEARLNAKLCGRNDSRSLKAQARPNVIFEAGLALGAHPKKTLLVQVGNTREISDIAGKHMLRLSNSGPSRKDLAQRLKKLGFKPDLTGTSWMTEGDFAR
jgi:predicted nucleotide-binding protein